MQHSNLNSSVNDVGFLRHQVMLFFIQLDIVYLLDVEGVKVKTNFFFLLRESKTNLKN